MRPIATLLLSTALAACGGSSKKPAPIKSADDTSDPAKGPAVKSLYDRLGGEPAVTAVVAEFVGRTTTDERIKDRFFSVEPESLKKLLVQFVCSAGGGGCAYEGRNMKATHDGMELVDEEFTALVEAMVGALDKFKVPEKEKGELLGALAGMKGDIVAPADKLRPIEDKVLAPVAKAIAAAKDEEVKRLLTMAVTAGKRGQRSYAEQLFSRAEVIAGAKSVATVAAVFRAGGPPRIVTPTKKLEDAGPQPAVVGGDDEAEVPKPKKSAVLKGTLTIDGKAPQGIGVVMLYGAKKAKRTPKQRIIEQRNKQFAPRVMAVPVGSTVSFPNYDTIFHNVFSVSKARPFDLGMYKSGETREIKVDKPGVIRVGCNIHASMAGFIIAVDAPHYVVVDSGGTFQFSTLSPGKYKAQVWMENAREPLQTEVEVKEGETEVTLDLAKGDTANPDKFGIAR